MAATTSTSVRRLSSADAKPCDLYSGPTVIAPPEDMKAPCDANGTATRLERARKSIDETASDRATPEVEPDPSSTDKFAIAFDIDGVLLKGGKALPESIGAMKYINGDNPYGVKIPYIFVTNGGGKTEEERCIDLSRQLQMEVSPGQFICGHTPMREMAEAYQTVLVVGGEGEKCRLVAEDYGFKDVVTPGDIIKSKHDTTPFRKLTEEEYRNSRDRNFDETTIDAIFVFADSRDWAGDQQIILDLLMSKNGRLGTRSETFDEGPPIYFSHNDIVWSTSHEHSRLGMGALRTSIEALYKELTGKELTTVAFGKPHLGTFGFATRLLREWRKETYGIDQPPATVYFVGDTPESDIRGTNEYNQISDTDWFSILVKTGVYQDNKTPQYPPRKVCEDVLEAVKFAVQRELGEDP
ncbi:hypothetical protein N7519_001761 [Penicillium mononematosum]|uniref:uncharacterized protein n=1 Tax=Penicillium mononematosum TaxID=268346 RepID=UPI002548ED54|nr:uncharacterized protein N7519_001761 [Penicillium mononematosum]KAJ6186853.1 hypothetical protein N7519_001761 [Penicillium mononematosum]